MKNFIPMGSNLYSSNDDKVLVQENMFVRTLTLNRSRQLNALSLEMLSDCRNCCMPTITPFPLKCFSRSTVEEILSALEKEAANINRVVGHEQEWLSSTIRSMKKASPISLKISLRSIREGRVQGVGECLVREYRMACHAQRGKISKDFREGCRAILWDKDSWIYRNPKWEPCKLELVTDQMVEYFSKLDDEEWEELKLPTRPHFPVTAMAKL